MSGKKSTQTVKDLSKAIRAGDRVALGRAITLIESARPEDQARARDLLKTLLPDTGKAIRVGISGVPGAGKSTLIDQLGVNLISQGHKVAVLAVDPTSSRTGGSILGDKTRMGRLASEDNAYIRPSPAGARSWAGTTRRWWPRSRRPPGASADTRFRTTGFRPARSTSCRRSSGPSPSSSSAGTS